MYSYINKNKIITSQKFTTSKRNDKNYCSKHKAKHLANRDGLYIYIHEYLPKLHRILYFLQF